MSVSDKEKLLHVLGEGFTVSGDESSSSASSSSACETIKSLFKSAIPSSPIIENNKDSIEDSIHKLKKTTSVVSLEPVSASDTLRKINEALRAADSGEGEDNNNSGQRMHHAQECQQQ